MGDLACMSLNEDTDLYLGKLAGSKKISGTL